MWNEITVIANSRFIDVNKLKKFIETSNLDCVSCEEEGIWISNWHVDGVIEAYKQHITLDVYREDRARLIRELLRANLLDEL